VGRFKLKNSEVGDGMFKIVPYAKFRVCFNGLAIESDAIGQVHLGGRLEQGTINCPTKPSRPTRTDQGEDEGRCRPVPVAAVLAGAGRQARREGRPDHHRRGGHDRAGW